MASGDGVSPWGNWASFWLACQASQPGCPVKHQGAALNCLVALSAYSILQQIDSACPCQKTRGFWVGVLNLVGACGSLASTATIWKSLGPAGRKGQIGEAYFPTVFFMFFR